MSKRFILLIIFILIVFETFGATDKGNSGISISWIVGQGAESFCNIGFRDNITKEVFPSEELQLEPVFENEKLIGRKENIEVFWEIYNKNDGVSIELRIEGNLSYLPDDYLGWGVFFTSDNPSLTSLHSSDNTSVILSKLSGKENSFYSGSVPIIISTDDASGKTIGASYRGELSLAIVSD